MDVVTKRIESWFLPIALICCALGLAWPPLFTWIRPHISVALGLIMFGMGLTLDFKDFLAVVSRWKLVASGVVLQYTIMPLLAVAASALFGLELEVAVGLAIVGACPGGTASNVITYLARGNVALSVTMTLISTSLAPVLAPAIIYFLYGERIDIDFLGMVSAVFWIVLFPLIDGLVLRRLLRERIAGLVRVFPSVSILTISAVIACVVALNQTTILAWPLLIIAAVTLHSMVGFAAGWGAGRLLGASRRDTIALSVEVGMQNSGLGVALAQTFFSALAALPGALFSLMQNLIGVVLARRWAREAEHENTSAH